jgi:hypothetical protein
VLHLPKFRFTLAQFLLAVLAIPVNIGVVAAVAFTASNQSYKWFGNDWFGEVRHFLIHSAGMSEAFVCGYVQFAMMHASAWVCYCVIAVILGLLRSKWSMPVGLTFVVSILVWDFLSDYHAGLHGYLDLRFVSLSGVILAAACFAAGRVVRGVYRPISEHRTSRLSRVVTAIALAGTIGFSVFGWWLIGLDRQAGREVQQWFDDPQNVPAQH